ncbi:lipoprotein [Cardiobacteriaceae bacterium TAE3-ERU3]|nr:lipoprotein [Cardiobacteriaceae bacterium TAE3-ERU3]
MKYWAMIIMLGGLVLVGCGQKGPLYLPKDDVAQEQNNG